MAAMAIQNQHAMDISLVYGGLYVAQRQFEATSSLIHHLELHDTIEIGGCLQPG